MDKKDLPIKPDAVCLREVIEGKYHIPKHCDRYY